MKSFRSSPPAMLWVVIFLQYFYINIPIRFIISIITITILTFICHPLWCGCDSSCDNFNIQEVPDDDRGCMANQSSVGVAMSLSMVSFLLIRHSWGIIPKPYVNKGGGGSQGSEGNYRAEQTSQTDVQGMLSDCRTLLETKAVLLLFSDARISFSNRSRTVYCDAQLPLATLSEIGGSTADIFAVSHVQKLCKKLHGPSPVRAGRVCVKISVPSLLVNLVRFIGRHIDTLQKLPTQVGEGSSYPHTHSKMKQQGRATALGPRLRPAGHVWLEAQ